MKILEEVVGIEHGDASKVASIFWDKNPIHPPVFPGTGLMAHAERMIRQTNRFQDRLNVGVNFAFLNLVYEGETVKFSRSGEGIVIKGMEGDVATFSLSKFSEIKFPKNGGYETVQRRFELEPERLQEFYKFVKAQNQAQVYFIFPVASIVSTFVSTVLNSLNQGEKIYLGRMDMNFSYQPTSSDLSTTIKFRQRSDGYLIYGRAEQEGRLICEGKGLASKKTD